MKRFYILFIIVFLGLNLLGENWNYHLSTVHTYDVVRGNKRIFFLSEGGIFYFDKRDNSINALTKVEGLSGSDFSGMEYSHATNSLIVYYQSSMVDIIPDDGSPIQIADIKRKNIAGNKAIFGATCQDEYCYLACGFGIVVLKLDLDPQKIEIKDSFIIGDGGNYEIVYDVALDDDNIYAAMADGIKYAPLDAPNLLDYNYWSYVDNKIVEPYVYRKLESGVNRVWATYEDAEWNVDRLISRHSEDTWYYEFTDYKEVDNVKFQGNLIVVAGRLLGAEREKEVRVYENNGGTVYSIKEYAFNDYDQTPYGTDTIPIDPRSAIIDTEGIVWIADWNYGAIRYKDGVFDIINPGGPVENCSFSMNFSNNKLWVAKGGRNKSWDNMYEDAVFQSFLYSENKWETFNEYSNPELDEYYDIVEILPTAGDPNHIYVGTWGGGILEYENGQLVKSYDETNSSLGNIIPGEKYIRIGGMDFDSQGNLWMSNGEVEKVLHKKSPNGTWQGYELPEIAYDYKLGKVVVDKFDNIWMVVPREKTYGLYVMSNDGRNKTQVNVKSYFSNGEDIPWTNTANDVFDLVEDKNGDMWVGTSKGAMVFDPEKVFTDNPYYATQPGLNKNDGIYHPLLQSETVTAIAIDGGNRKYLGTKSSGIYLVSADGREEIKHYNTENSNLISDWIVSLEYDGANGILYIGTDRGLVSLQTESKESFDSYNNVYAYPNPVRPGYEGDIYITGLMENSNVKIASVSGQLVYETTSVGGQAAWNGCDLDGNKVHTGVYVVFCASEDGQESAVTKILFIRSHL